MPELISVVLAALPFVAFVVLLVEAFRDSPTAGDGVTIDLFHRSFGA